VIFSFFDIQYISQDLSGLLIISCCVILEFLDIICQFHLLLGYLLMNSIVIFGLYESNDTTIEDVKLVSNNFRIDNGLGGIGKSVVLTVDLDTWVIITETFFVFETDQACYPILSKIDDSIPGIEFYLCDYSYWNTEGAGKSVILTVDTSAWYIDMLTCFEFESSPITAPTLSKIDENQH